MESELICKMQYVSPAYPPKNIKPYIIYNLKKEINKDLYFIELENRRIYLNQKELTSLFKILDDNISFDEVFKKKEVKNETKKKTTKKKNKK